MRPDIRRWPLIRHLRWLYYLYQVNRHYDRWLSLGRAPVHAAEDYRVLDQIRRGER